MGTDNLHHRRKQRGAKSLQRKRAKRAPYDYVLIVCEGSKTECQYLQDLVADLHLNNANIHITGDCGSAPISVVQAAIDAFNADRDYDCVYCVFDRDDHASYQQALDSIAHTRLNRNNGRKTDGQARFEAITSIPCFEYWLLLHFEYTTCPFAPTPQASPCKHIVDTLESRHYLAGYTKGMAGLYARTKSRLGTAESNAVKALKAAQHAGTDNPSTRIHELIAYLKNIKA